MILNGVFSNVIFRIPNETEIVLGDYGKPSDPLAPETPSVILYSDTGIIDTIVDNSNSGE